MWASGSMDFRQAQGDPRACGPVGALAHCMPSVPPISSFNTPRLCANLLSNLYFNSSFNLRPQASMRWDVPLRTGNVAALRNRSFSASLSFNPSFEAHL